MTSAANINAPTAANSQKIACQVLKRISWPPSNGPTMGATATISVKVESICAARVCPYKSRIIARASIGAVQAPTAWNTRQNMISPMPSDRAQPAEPSANNTMPA